jgi:hypothetical protein
MQSGWASLLAAGLAWAVPAKAQRVAELGAHALVATSDPALAVGGVYAAVRASQRIRVAVTAGVGASAGAAAARGEVLGHFLLNPGGWRGVGAYAGGGIAGVAGPLDDGYLVLLLGVEARPGAGSGWAVEAGVGGGVRIAVGYRWRRHPRPRRSRGRNKRNRPGGVPGRCENARLAGIRPRRSRP